MFYLRASRLPGTGRMLHNNPMSSFPLYVPPKLRSSATAEPGRCQQWTGSMVFRRGHTHLRPLLCGRWCSDRKPPSSLCPPSGGGSEGSPGVLVADSQRAPWSSRRPGLETGERRLSPSSSETWSLKVCRGRKPQGIFTGSLTGGSVNYQVLNHALNRYCLRKINIFFLKFKDNVCFCWPLYLFRVMGRVQEPLPAPWGWRCLWRGFFPCWRAPRRCSTGNPSKLSALGLQPATLRFNNDTCKSWLAKPKLKATRVLRQHSNAVYYRNLSYLKLRLFNPKYKKHSLLAVKHLIDINTEAQT